MKINVLTLFPEFFTSFVSTSIIKKAVLKKKVEFNFINFREYSKENNKRVDFPPYGGGNGMIISVEPIYTCLKENNLLNTYKILLSPEGKTYNQKQAFSLAKKEELTIICGHYEGIDKRIDKYIDCKISIGDFILTGGEASSICLIDSIVRLLDGVIKIESYMDESFSNNLLEYDQYTYPREFDNEVVPDILFSGNHKEVDKYRLTNSLIKTKNLRYDLYKNHEFSKEEIKILNSLDEKTSN